MSTKKKPERTKHRRILKAIICIAITIQLVASSAALEMNAVFADTAKSIDIATEDKEARNTTGSILFNVWYEHPISGKKEILSSQRLTITSDGNSDEDLKNSDSVPTKWNASLSLEAGNPLFTLTDTSAETTENVGNHY